METVAEHAAKAIEKAVGQEDEASRAIVNLAFTICRITMGDKLGIRIGEYAGAANYLRVSDINAAHESVVTERLHPSSGVDPAGPG